MGSHPCLASKITNQTNNNKTNIVKIFYLCAKQLHRNKDLIAKLQKVIFGEKSVSSFEGINWKAIKYNFQEIEDDEFLSGFYCPNFSNKLSDKLLNIVERFMQTFVNISVIKQVSKLSLKDTKPYLDNANFLVEKVSQRIECERAEAARWNTRNLVRELNQKYNFLVCDKNSLMGNKYDNDFRSLFKKRISAGLRNLPKNSFGKLIIQISMEMGLFKYLEEFFKITGFYQWLQSRGKCGDVMFSRIIKTKSDGLAMLTIERLQWMFFYPIDDEDDYLRKTFNSHKRIFNAKEMQEIYDSLLEKDREFEMEQYLLKVERNRLFRVEQDKLKQQNLRKISNEIPEECALLVEQDVVIDADLAMQFACMYEYEEDICEGDLEKELEAEETVEIKARHIEKARKEAEELARIEAIPDDVLPCGHVAVINVFDGCKHKKRGGIIFGVVCSSKSEKIPVFSLVRMSTKGKHRVKYKSGEVIFISANDLEESWYTKEKNVGFKKTSRGREWKKKTVYNGNWNQFANVCMQRAGCGNFEQTEEEKQALRIDEGWGHLMMGAQNAKTNVVHFGNPKSVFELSFGMSKDYYQPKRFRFRELGYFRDGNDEKKLVYTNYHEEEGANEDLDVRFEGEDEEDDEISWDESSSDDSSSSDSEDEDDGFNIYANC